MAYLIIGTFGIGFCPLLNATEDLPKACQGSFVPEFIVPEIESKPVMAIPNLLRASVDSKAITLDASTGWINFKYFVFSLEGKLFGVAYEGDIEDGVRHSVILPHLVRANPKAKIINADSFQVRIIKTGDTTTLLIASLLVVITEADSSFTEKQVSDFLANQVKEGFSDWPDLNIWDANNSD